MKIGFFEEGPNIKSWLRLIATIPIIAGVLIGVVESFYSMYVIWYDKSFTVHTELVGTFLGGGFLSKVIQKYFEVKSEVGESKSESDEKN